MSNDHSIWLSLALGALGFGAVGIGRALNRIADAMCGIQEHLRIIRQHDLPEATRALGSVVEGIHNPIWRK